MKIGFHYHIPALKNSHGKIYTPGYLGVFLDGLAKECDELICFLHDPLDGEIELMDYELTSSNIQLINIGPHETMLKRALNSKRYMRDIKKHISKVDLMLIRGPSPLLPSVVKIAKNYNIPYSYLIVGDYLKSLSGVKSMNKIKKMLLFIFYKMNKTLQDFYAKKALIFTNNRIVFNEYNHAFENVYEIKTTTLSKNDFFEKKDTSFNKPIKIAYVGRIEPSKGIDDILKAVELLNLEGIKSQLHIAGWDPSINNDYLIELKEIVKKEKLDNMFFFHGKKKMGKELFSFYRSCDLFVVATKGNEGFPRTIWEAMSQSLPIISTKVGSIPLMLEDQKSVLLIKQGNFSELYKKIKILKDNDALREKLIKNGYDLAQTNTLEIQSKKMINIVNNYLKYKG